MPAEDFDGSKVTVDVIDVDDVIGQSEARAFRYLIYPFTMLTAFIVVGSICNTLVVYIFAFSWAKSKTCIFILSLACLDMTSCFLNMPMDIAILFNPLSFDHNLLCKLSRYLTYIVSASYSFVLVAIAIDRYIMVCKPLTSLTISRKYALKVCVGAVIAAAVSQLPSVFIYGTRTIPLTPSTNQSASINGKTCLISDDADVFVTRGFYLFLFAGHIVIFLSFFIIYILIGRRLYISSQGDLLSRMSGSRTRLLKESIFSAVTGVIPRSALCSGRSRTSSIDISSKVELPVARKNGASRRRPSDNVYKVSETDVSYKQQQNGQLLSFCSEDERVSPFRRGKRSGSLSIEVERASMRIKDTDLANCDAASPLRVMVAPSGPPGVIPRSPARASFRRAKSMENCNRLSACSANQGSPDIKELSLRQNTLIMRMVTFTFMLSYLPFLVIVTLRYTDRKIPYSLPFVNRVLYELFIRSYYFNSIIRPFIYIIMNVEFRKKVWNLLRCGRHNNVY